MTQQDKNNRLICIAAELVGHSYKLSDFKEDYTFKIPNHMIKKIREHNDKLKRIAIELADIARSKCE